MATIPSGKTEKWEENCWAWPWEAVLTRGLGGTSSLHSATPHAHVIRLLMLLSADKGEAAAKSLEMKLGRLSQFLWD